MLSAIAALSGGSGALAYPRVAIARVMLCATVNDGDRLHQHPAVADDQQQAEHEEQVVDAEQDVLDAERAGTRAPAPTPDVRAPRVTDGVDGLEQVALQPAVRVVHADDDVGDRRLEPVDRERLSRDAAVAASACRGRTTAPGVSACWPAAASRHPCGTSGAM